MARKKRPNRCDKTVDMFVGPGWEEKAAGIALAQAKESEEWKRRYRELAELFLANLPPWSDFNGEHITEFALLSGLGQPHVPQCWGANSGGVLARWRNAGRIVESQFTSYARKKKAHGRRYPTYTKVNL